MKTCPRCAEQVQEAARVCRFCGHEFGQSAVVKGDRVSRKLGCGGIIAIVFLTALAAQSCDPKTGQPATEQAKLIDDATRAQQAQSAPALPEPTKDNPTGPAPIGLPKVVGRAAIDKAGHKCGTITTAIRIPVDGSIIATCSDGIRYRVFTMYQVGTVAMNCTAAKELLDVDGC